MMEMPGEGGAAQSGRKTLKTGKTGTERFRASGTLYMCKWRVVLWYMYIQQDKNQNHSALASEGKQKSATYR
jgi:hypothetical protein